MENKVSLTINLDRKDYAAVIAMAKSRGINLDAMMGRLILEQRRRITRLIHLQRLTEVKFRFKGKGEEVLTYLGTEFREYESKCCSWDGKPYTRTDILRTPVVRNEAGETMVLHKNDWEEQIEVIWE